MGLVRYQDWASRLEKEIDKRRTMPFKFGKHDCCMAVCACVKAMTGVNLAKDFVKYASKEKAHNLLKEWNGVKAIAEIFADKYDIEEINANRASTGDVVLINQDNRDTLGILAGGGNNILAPGKIGWLSVSRNMIIKAWRI